jgi:DNA-binding response OmpR family regulator
VACAANRSEGWELARGYEFDASVLDVMLPKMSGFELAKKLRGEQITTPVLILTRKIPFPEPDPASV